MTTHLHELTLHASVPASRHTQILHILTGVAGHAPNTVTERHSLFRPQAVAIKRVAADEGGGRQDADYFAKLKRRAAEAAKEGAGEKGGQGWVMRAVETLNDEGSQRQGNETGGESMEGVESIEARLADAEREEDAEARSHTDGLASEQQTRAWSWRHYAVPDPNTKAITLRATTQTSVPYASYPTPASFAESRDFRPLPGGVYVVHGQQWIHYNVILLLHQVFHAPPEAAARLEPADIEKLKPLDGSGAYVLEARLMVEEGVKNEVMTRAISELVSFKDSMRGCVEMRTVERLSLDTRAK